MTTTVNPETETRFARYPMPPVPQPKKKRKARALPLLVTSLVLVIAAGLSFAWWSTHSAEAFPTPYQAVLLSNGAVYYGELQGYGTRNPVLTHVFYIVSRTDANTKAVSNVLVKRGKELHEPDRMYLNPNSITFVETVGKSSKVAQLISDVDK